MHKHAIVLGPAETVDGSFEHVHGLNQRVLGGTADQQTRAKANPCAVVVPGRNGSLGGATCHGDDQYSGVRLLKQPVQEQGGAHLQTARVQGRFHATQQEVGV